MERYVEGLAELVLFKKDSCISQCKLEIQGNPHKNPNDVFYKIRKQQLQKHKRLNNAVLNSILKPNLMLWSYSNKNVIQVK